MLVSRKKFHSICEDIGKGKIILLFGPRQVGKSTLIQEVVDAMGMQTLMLNGDEHDTQQALQEMNIVKWTRIIGNNKLVCIDEAQRIPNIGLTLKIAVDNFKDVQFIATGSSAFEIANQTQESLTGRKWEYYLFPLSFQELVNQNGYLQENRLLEERLIYGSYPDVINHPSDEKRILNTLAESYLYKDIFSFQLLKKADVFHKLLKALAFQVGNEVSYNELAQTVGADKETIERYIELLEKSFIVFRLNAFSRNIRNELKKSRKIYFYDNGIRNSIISNFNPLSNRDDLGALWENYLISERYKNLVYAGFYGNRYFWRTTQQQEVDYLEEQDGKICAFEFKWNSKKNHRISKTFLVNYPEITTQIITPLNFDSFLLDEI